MKKLIVILTMLVSTTLSAGAIRPGDVVLISLECMLCQAIEVETNSDFSHSGLVVSFDGTEVKLVESLGTVSTISIKEFTKRRREGSKLAVMRNYELDYLYQTQPGEFYDRTDKMIENLNSKFMGAKFDKEFLWDNYDEDNNELLYCSEMIAKLLNTILQDKLEPKPMSFQKLPKFWDNYFNGKVPEGELGNSPESFFSSEKFFRVL